ncbi:hypothetical protein HYDPIDRAFT_117329 [Hydnomerulius pinastri MD-312]|uniref:Uncharacterized protein n=1 Tax=Hydnomerulius pinastri MD-312 TaxID=994086 RepID=A0A0C9VRF0_9AGAM|nr:hypothetical protein HYDPIDRAFT_117329 [Hydnomerulius pinastri MD-312]
MACRQFCGLTAFYARGATAGMLPQPLGPYDITVAPEEEKTHCRQTIGAYLHNARYTDAGQSQDHELNTSGNHIIANPMAASPATSTFTVRIRVRVNHPTAISLFVLV